MVKESELQNLIANHTQNIFDNLWLGGVFDNESKEFKWEDGELLTYTNWLESYPRNTTDSAIEFRPLETLDTSRNVAGKWADVPRQKRNLVMCQRKLVWTLENAVDEIIRLRKELKQEAEKFSEQLDQIKSQVIPVGSIYVEYYDQPSPKTLWPSIKWQDVTNTYAGLFFRAFDNTESWGLIESDCAPRITQVQHEQSTNGELFPWGVVSVPKGDWSEYGRVGDNNYPPQEGQERYYEGLRFYTEDCEVRPKNQGIRLWKRVA